MKNITQKEIEAAAEIHSRLTQWCEIDQSIAKLASKFPDWSLESTIVKATVIDSLYSTNIKQVIPIARHVCQVFSEKLKKEDLVLAIADFRSDGGDKMLTSFASKLCHFFVSEEDFPIYDGLAVNVLVQLGGARETGKLTRYRVYCENFYELKKASSLICKNRDLDRYLWLAGCYRKWKNGSSPDDAANESKKAKINKEVQGIFGELKKESSPLLEALVVPALRYRNAGSA